MNRLKQLSDNEISIESIAHKVAILSLKTQAQRKVVCSETALTDANLLSKSLRIVSKKREELPSCKNKKKTHFDDLNNPDIALQPTMVETSPFAGNNHHKIAGTIIGLMRRRLQNRSGANLSDCGISEARSTSDGISTRRSTIIRERRLGNDTMNPVSTSSASSSGGTSRSALILMIQTKVGDTITEPTRVELPRMRQAVSVPTGNNSVKVNDCTDVDSYSDREAVTLVENTAVSLARESVARDDMIMMMRSYSEASKRRGERADKMIPAVCRNLARTAWSRLIDEEEPSDQRGDRDIHVDEVVVSESVGSASSTTSPQEIRAYFQPEQKICEAPMGEEGDSHAGVDEKNKEEGEGSLLCYIPEEREEKEEREDISSRPGEEEREEDKEDDVLHEANAKNESKCDGTVSDEYDDDGFEDIDDEIGIEDAVPADNWPDETIFEPTDVVDSAPPSREKKSQRDDDDDDMYTGGASDIPRSRPRSSNPILIASSGSLVAQQLSGNNRVGADKPRSRRGIKQAINFLPALVANNFPSEPLLMKSNNMASRVKLKVAKQHTGPYWHR